MRKIVLSTLLVAVASLTAIRSYAQPTGDSSIAYLYITSYDTSSFCAPVDVYYYGSLFTKNYAMDSPVEITVKFDDGTDTSFVTTVGQAMQMQFRHTHTLPGKYTPRITAKLSDTTAHAKAEWPVMVYDNCGDVTGRVYLDQDNDCENGSGDVSLKGVYLYLKGEDSFHQFTYTNESGEYTFEVPEGMEFEISVMEGEASEDFCPSVIRNSSPSDNNDFGYICNSSEHDLSVTGFGWGLRPGREGDIYVKAGNDGCYPKDASVYLILDNNVSYVSAEPEPSAVMGQKLVWEAEDLYKLNSFGATVKVLGSTNAQLGDKACFVAGISILPGESDPADNNATFCTEFRNSWDPNDKRATINGFSEEKTDIESTDELYYRIRFQNKGNDVAYDIYVLDTIHPNLDLTTMEILGTSHPMNIYMGDDRVIKFDFPEIMLPDDKSNEPLSHGYILYRIKPVAGLDVNSQMTNTAHIYFDFNPAVVTNTTFNKIADHSGVAEFAGASSRIYPNPAGSMLKVSSRSTIQRVEVLDLLGHSVMELKPGKNDVTLNVSSLAEGIYIVNLLTAEGRKTEKLIVNR